MGTVVVTGAAGSLGRRVVELLAGRQEVDRIVGIDVVPAPDLPPSVEMRTLDLSGTTDLEKSLTDCVAVIHLAWHTPDRLDTRSVERTAVSQSNQTALRRVLEAAAAAGVPRVVHLSSATVYGAWPDNRIPLTENAPLRPNPEFVFAVSKAEAERLVAEWADENPDVAVAVLRPAVTVGSPERPLYRALGGTRAPRGADGGARPVQFLHVDDLASAVVHISGRRDRGVFNVAPDNGIGEEVARALIGGVAKVTLPGRLARSVSAWTWKLWRAGVPREAMAYATHPWVIAADRLRATGWVAQYSSEEALVATDARVHWDDLPPGTRQNYTVLAVLAGGGTLAGGLLIGLRAVRARRRQRGRR